MLCVERGIGDHCCLSVRQGGLTPHRPDKGDTNEAHPKQEDELWV